MTERGATGGADTLSAALVRAAERIGGESPRLDAEILLAHVLKKSRTWLYTWPEKHLDQETRRRFDRLVERRVAGEPVAHLTGEREFWSLSLRVNASTLIPRPDTECLVELALALPLPDRAGVLDLGTGTGAIALALASERPNWRVTAVDLSASAVELARDNARRLGLDSIQFLCGHWFTALEAARFDLIVANPPYVDPADPLLSQGDLRFEPRGALVAGDAGLADLRHIVQAAPDWLFPGGWLVLEHGWDQGMAVRELLTTAGYTRVITYRDYGGQERVTLGRNAPQEPQ